MEETAIIIHIDTIIGASNVKGRINSIYPKAPFLKWVVFIFFTPATIFYSILKYKGCWTFVTRWEKITIVSSNKTEITYILY